MSNKFNTLSLLPKVVYDAIFLKIFPLTPRTRKGRRPLTALGAAPQHPCQSLLASLAGSPPRSKILATCLLFAPLIGFRRPLELFVPHIFFFHQHQMLIWPTYCTFLQPMQMRRHKATPMNYVRGSAPIGG